MYLWQVPKLLLHRLFPNVRYSIWIDGKLQLVVDPYQILERYIWFAPSCILLPAEQVIHSFCWFIPSSFSSLLGSFMSFFFSIPYLRFLWRQNATFAISRHYRRFDVFEEAEANKAAGKYDNVSIDHQIGFYRKEGLTAYSEAKLPITSGGSMYTLCSFAHSLSKCN